MFTDLEALTRYVGHVRQAVLAATGERQRTIRLFVLALAEAELARLKQEEGATMDGKLHYTDKGKILLDTDLEAAQAFGRTPQLQGLVSLECQVNPAQVSELPQIVELNKEGFPRLSLPVVGSNKVRRGHVFVCGEQPPSPPAPLPEGEGSFVAGAAL